MIIGIMLEIKDMRTGITEAVFQIDLTHGPVSQGARLPASVNAQMLKEYRLEITPLFKDE